MPLRERLIFWYAPAVIVGLFVIYARFIAPPSGGYSFVLGVLIVYGCVPAAIFMTPVAVFKTIKRLFGKH